MITTKQLASKSLCAQSIDRTRSRIKAIKRKGSMVELYDFRCTTLDREGFILEVLEDVQKTLEGGSPCPRL